MGEGVTEFKAGDEVWGFHNLGLPGCVGLHTRGASPAWLVARWAVGLSVVRTWRAVIWLGRAACVSTSLTPLLLRCCCGAAGPVQPVMVPGHEHRTAGGRVPQAGELDQCAGVARGGGARRHCAHACRARRPLRCLLTYVTVARRTYTQASTLGITGLTAIQALFHPDLLNMSPPSAPTEGGEFVLVWGASSTVGQFAVQLAAQAGYKVIATASAKNHELITSLGAVGVVDYHDEDAVDQIKAIGLPVLALDCASAETALKCALAINPETGGRVVAIGGTPSEGVPENVTVKVRSAVRLAVTRAAQCDEPCLTC